MTMASPSTVEHCVNLWKRSEADVAEVTETAKPAAQNDVGPLQSAGE
ncbi:hypothetical protein [Photorhabdus laumondii]|nr:hypothetical protein [Photorhabdus laumondii]